MQQSVIDTFIRFTQPLEGRVHHMYLDVLGLVTTGIGNLVDPVKAAKALPWKAPDGTLATAARVEAEWSALKARQDLKTKHFRFAAPVTTVRLTDADIDALVLRRLLENVAFLRKALPAFDTYPADAQLGICSMAWAVGAGFTKKFPTFTAAAKKQDFRGVKAASKIRTQGNPGIVPRNTQNAICFENAAVVLERGLDPSVLHWPKALAPKTPSRPPRKPKAPRKPKRPARPRRRTLRLQDPHMEGEDVRVLQRAIGADPDGDFGKNTEKALRAFQRKHGLDVDGVAGKETWKKIERIG
jgi:peptidoglycan hydrolase-like protein with peptidoglycan-binding domain